MAEITVILNKHGFAVTTNSAVWGYHVLGAEDALDRRETLLTAMEYHHRWMKKVYDPKLGRAR